MISDALSKKIKVVSFFSIVMVVFIHASDLVFKDNRLIYSDGLWIKNFVQFFISQGIARAAVPLFFAIAGFLFYQNTSEPMKKWYFAKVKARFHSLFIPYVFWTSFSAVVFLLIVRCSLHGGVFSDSVIQRFGGRGIFDLIFLSPIAYQFWFVRDLLVIALVSPFLYFMLVRFGMLFVGLLFVLLITDITVPYFGIGSMLYFAIGGYVALKNISNIEVSRAAARVFLLSWVGLIVARDIAFVDYHFVFYQVDVICSGIGMLAVWLNYDFLYRRFEGLALRFSGATFFIFCAHEPALWMLKKIVHHGFYETHSGLTFLVSYFILPIVWIFLLVVLSGRIRSKFPRLYMYINGGR